LSNPRDYLATYPLLIKKEREETLKRGQSPLSYLHSLRKRNTEGESKRGVASLTIKFPLPNKGRGSK